MIADNVYHEMLDTEGPCPRMRQLFGHADTVHAVSFSPDRRWVVSGSADGTVCAPAPHSHAACSDTVMVDTVVA